MRTRFLTMSALLALGAVVTTTLIGCAAPVGHKPPYVDLTVGQCFDTNPGGVGGLESTSTVTIEDCGDPHQFEYMGSVSLAGEFTEDPKDVLADGCIALYLDYTGTSIADATEYGAVSFTPEIADFDLGYTDGYCFVAGLAGAAGTEITGSPRVDPAE